MKAIIAVKGERLKEKQDPESGKPGSDPASNGSDPIEAKKRAR